MKSTSNNIWLGLGLGLAAPWLIVVIFYYVKFAHVGFGDFLELAYLNQIFTPLISLCVLINLGVFYIFIWTHNYISARGIVSATLIYAAAIFILKLVQPGYEINY